MNRRRFMGDFLTLPLDCLLDYYKFNNTTKDEITGVTNTANLSYSEGIKDKSAYFSVFTPLKFAKDQALYDNFTISVWVKPDLGSFPDQYRGIFVSRSGNETNLNGLCLEDRTLIVYRDSQRAFTTSISPGYWTMITLTIKNSIGTIYINGSELSKFTYYDFFIRTQTYIGCDYLPVTTSQNNRGLRGYLDELSVWMVELSASEVNALYNNGYGLELYL